PTERPARFGRSRERKGDLGRGRVRRFSRARPRGGLRDERFDHKLAVTGLASDSAVRFAKKEPGSGGLEVTGPYHQGDLPWFAERAVVKLEIGVRKEDLAPRMRVIPTDRLAVVEQRAQVFAIPFGEGKARTEGMRTLQRSRRFNLEAALFPASEEHA